MAEEQAEWFANEEFWEVNFPFMFPQSRFDGAADEVTKLLQLAAVDTSQPLQVLDLACGPARHTMELARRGHAVTGVDRTGFLLEKARARLALADAGSLWPSDVKVVPGCSNRVTLVKADMREFLDKLPCLDEPSDEPSDAGPVAPKHRTYDLALSLFTSFGYFQAPDDDMKVLRNLHAALKPKGVLVMDMVGKELLGKTFQRTVSQSVPQLPHQMLVARHEVCRHFTRMHLRWAVCDTEKGTCRQFEFEHSLYSAQELVDRLQAAGFPADLVRVYGSLEGAEYNFDASRLVVVARKE